MLRKFYQVMLRLDSGLLKSDSKLTKLLKIYLLKPVGYYFRKKNFDRYYPELKLK